VSWLAPITVPATAKRILVCFPPAAGGAASFSALRHAAPASWAVWAVRLPGRESRLGQPPETDFAQVVGKLVDDVDQLPAGELSFFGHCLGALLAYDVAQGLQVRARPLAQLIVGAQPAPSIPASPQIDDIDGLSLQDLANLLGQPAIADPANERLMRVMAPALRADLKLAAGYCYKDMPPIEAPIVTIGASEPDGEGPSLESLEAWREHTSAVFSLIRLPGTDASLSATMAEAVSLMGAPGRQEERSPAWRQHRLPDDR
jgi:medium-chain acyl-[acyl-carrier-protein] hydrolase